MAHEDAGHYAAKHPEGTRADPEIENRAKQKISDGKITCAAAHQISQELGASPANVGITIDLLEARISKCQLGLFGYQPEKSVVKPADSPSAAIQTAIENVLENGRISCENCWQIAEQQKEKKMSVSSVCEALSFKVTKCQLGAF